jgi:lipopolysaccharide transport system ATP-binding protein
LADIIRGINVSDIVIKAEDLGKSYLISHQTNSKHDTLRDVIADKTKGLLSKIRKPKYQTNENIEEFWALKDVSFEVKKGERLAIIGRNGAGKSTLLKILSRITEPTTGALSIQGRVASLLEVGTGFHSELSGRENIYLNGAILGMSRREIKAKFDEIVAFAEIEKFLDTPVKRYSSGMYVRLAFAVAAHLEQEILIVDEVLAVGDSEFQKKCLGKMQEVTTEGRTVLFVSHNMVAVQQLCQRGLMLHQGTLMFCGTIGDTIRNYMGQVKTLTSIEVGKRKDRTGSQWLKFTKVVIYDSQGDEIHRVMSGQDISIRLYYESEKEMQNALVFVSFNLRNNQGFLLTNLNSVDSGFARLDIYRRGYFECQWPKFNLRLGEYDCNLYCSINDDIVDWMQSAFIINVEDGNFFQSGKLVGAQGDILIHHSWSCGRTD